MHCGLLNMDHASWITRATFFEIAVFVYAAPKGMVLSRFGQQYCTDFGHAWSSTGNVFFHCNLKLGIFFSSANQVNIQEIIIMLLYTTISKKVALVIHDA